MLPNPTAHTLTSSATREPKISRLSVSRPNQSVPVYDDWRLGANTPQFADYKGWVDLIIESPNPLTKRIGFAIHCQ